MPEIVNQIFEFLGYLLSALGFLVFGLGAGWFTLDGFRKGVWQVQIALALGFFGLLIALAYFTTPGSAGAFALGAGIAFFMWGMPKKGEEKEK